jgi:hypothetical protein
MSGGKVVFRTMTPVFEASRIRRAYHEVSGFTAAELVDAEDRLDLARRRRIGSEIAEVMIGAIPGAPAAKDLDRYVCAVISTAAACGEAMSPLSFACAVGELVRKKKTLPLPDEFAAWHRAELARIDALATALDRIPTPPLRSSRPGCHPSHPRVLP